LVSCRASAAAAAATQRSAKRTSLPWGPFYSLTLLLSWQVVVLAAVIGATIISTAIIIGHFLPRKI